MVKPNSFVRQQRTLRARLFHLIKLMTAGLLGLAAALVAYIYIPRSLPPQPDSFMLIAHQSNLYLFSGEEQYAQLKQEIPDVQRLFSSRREVKDCIPD